MEIHLPTNGGTKSSSGPSEKAASWEPLPRPTRQLFCPHLRLCPLPLMPREPIYQYLCRYWYRYWQDSRQARSPPVPQQPSLRSVGLRKKRDGRRKNAHISAGSLTFRWDFTFASGLGDRKRNRGPKRPLAALSLETSRRGRTSSTLRGGASEGCSVDCGVLGVEVHRFKSCLPMLRNIEIMSCSIWMPLPGMRFGY